MTGIPPRRPGPLRPSGSFDRRHQRDPIPFIIGGVIIFLAFLLIILFAPPISLLSGGDDEDNGELVTQSSGLTFRTTSDFPPLPPNLINLSPYLFDISIPNDLAQGSLVLRLQLAKATQDPSNIGFYTFEDGRWQRVASATLSADGSEAQGELTQVPATLAVLRSASSRLAVSGWLPPDSTVHPEAQGLITMVNPLGIGPKPDGTLGGGISQVPGGSYQVFPAITASSEEAVKAVNSILSDAGLTQKHIDQILTLVEGASPKGIDIDYRAVNPALKSQFTNFISSLAQRLHDENKQLSITLPLPEREGGAWRTGAYDWQALGERADIIKISPEDNQAVYHVVMPDVLTYATSQAPAAKLFLIISPFSHEGTGNSIRSLSILEAMGTASIMSVRSPNGPIEGGSRVVVAADNIYRPDGASGVRWDDTAKAVSFAFERDGEERTVWVENLYSAAFKLALVKLFNLGGIAVEDASAESGGADIWPAISAAASGNLNLAIPHPDNLKIEWQASEGNIQPSNNGAVTWNAPRRSGAFEITVIVSDGVLRVGRRLKLEVSGENPGPIATEEPRAPASPSPTPQSTQQPTASPAPGTQPTPTPTTEPTSSPAPEAQPTPGATPTPQGGAPEPVPSPTSPSATPGPTSTGSPAATLPEASPAAEAYAAS